jgi:RNA 2',3'-cyclic 3'-phosphodiesterase
VIRSFVAFDLPRPVIEKLADVQKRLEQSASGVRWVNPGSIHLTINFLGDIDEELTAAIHGAMRESVAGSPALALYLSEIGAFPNKSRPRVIWAGLGGDVGNLSRIKMRLDDLLEPLGFTPERRPFRPHLTIGRVKKNKNPRQLNMALEQAEVADHDPFMVTDLVLYKSELSPRGAKYTSLAKAELTG